MHSYLQTKAVSLQLEAKYIRKQEMRFAKAASNAKKAGRERSAEWNERNRQGQHAHRVTVVRKEARITNIARAFLRGRSYSDVERVVYTKPDWARVTQLVACYVERDNPRWNRPVIDVFNDWRTEAEQHIKSIPPWRSVDVKTS